MAWSGNFTNEFGTQNSWPDGTNVSVTLTNHSRPNARGPTPSDEANMAETQLKNISPLSKTNTIIIGVVISKQEPRVIPSKSDPKTDRGILSFTIRDSPVDFINVSYWGSHPFIQQMATTFKIGDIVEIRNPQIQTKQITEQEERYRPWTPSQFQLTLSEKYSTLCLYGGWNVDQFNKLQHVPIRESDNYYSLTDIITNGSELNGEHVNLLVLIKKTGTPKDIVTKTGKKMQRCEVRVYDETCPSFPLVLWDRENIDLVQRCTPNETADIAVKFDDFRSCMTGSIDSKTILITNPDTNEAHSLFKFGQSRDPNDDQPDDSSGKEVDLSTITDVYKVHKIRCCLSGDKSEGAKCGITYAFLTSLDIDNCTRNGVTTRCTGCKRRVDDSVFSCVNPNCPSFVSGKTDTVLTLDVSIELSDATGTLGGCYLGGAQAEELFRCSTDEFLQYTEQQKTDLKWTYLLERCKIYFKVLPPGVNRSKGIIRILSCTKSDVMEIVPHL